MRMPRYSLLQLLLASALVALLLGLFTSVWRARSTNEIRSVHFSPSGKLLAAHYESGAIQIWRLGNRSPRRVAMLPPRRLMGEDVSTLQFVADDRLLRLQWSPYDQGSTVEEIDLRTMRARTVAQIDGDHFAFTAKGTDGRRLVLQDWVQGKVDVYNLQTSRIERTIPTSGQVIQALSDDGQTVAVAADLKLELFDVNTGESIRRLTIEEESAALALSGDGKLLAYVHYPPAGTQATATISLYNVESEAERRLVSRLDEVYWLAFSGDGRRLAASGWPNFVEVYDLEQGEKRLCRIPLGESPAVFAAPALSADGQLLAAFNRDGIMLWDATTGRLRHTITGDSRTLQTAIFTLGFALWAAAWGIVRKRERVRRVGGPPQRAGLFAQPIGPPSPPELGSTRSLSDMAWLLILAGILVGVPTAVLTWSEPWSPEVTIETVGFVLGVLLILFLLAPAWTWLYRLIHGPHYPHLARLRQIVRDEGRMHTCGQLRVWCSGRTYSEPAFDRVYDETVRRAGELYGQRREFSRPSLVAVLDWQTDYDAFFGCRLAAAVAAPREWTERVAVLCEESALANLIQPVAVYRAALSALLQVEHKGDILPGWVYQLATLPAVWDEELPAQRRAAARRLRVLFARQPEWKPQDVFLRSDEDRALLVAEADPAASWRESVAEGDVLLALADALLGESAPPERRNAVLAWLRAFRPHDDPLTSLRRDCNLSLDDLVAIVRRWVADVADDHYDPMPDFKQYVLRTVHAPALANRELPLLLRQWIVGSLGGCDYVAAAEPLLLLAADPDSPLKTQALCALEQLSGECLGDDPPRWRAWWDELPAAVRLKFPCGTFSAADAPVPWQSPVPEASAEQAEEAAPQSPTADADATSVADEPPPWPAELFWVWSLMAVGGLVALGVSIQLLFASGPLMFPVYMGLFVGMAAMARAAALDEQGLTGTATLQVLNLLACDPVNPILAIVELTLLSRSHVSHYLRYGGLGRSEPGATSVQ